MVANDCDDQVWWPNPLGASKLSLGIKITKNTLEILKLQSEQSLGKVMKWKESWLYEQSLFTLRVRTGQNEMVQWHWKVSISNTKIDIMKTVRT